MSRVPQIEGARGSLKWIQYAIEHRWPSLEQPIVDRIGADRIIEWRSPIRMDGFAEYRDGDFLKRVGLSHLQLALAEFWPQRGPQWDALGVTQRGEVLLVEAKAHIGELCSPPSSAGPASRAIIADRLSTCALRLGVRTARALWTDQFYQLANRLAHLQFLRDQGVAAFLILVNFLNDVEMKGPAAVATWEAAYEVAFHVMGLSKRHPLAQYVVDVFPDVSALRTVT